MFMLEISRKQSILCRGAATSTERLQRFIAENQHGDYHNKRNKQNATAAPRRFTDDDGKR